MCLFGIMSKKWLQFRYDLNNYARMHTLIMKIHNNHLLFWSSKVQIKINRSEMTTKHHIFKLILQDLWLKGLWHQYRFENKVWVLGPLCDHLIDRNSISKSAASKFYKRLSECEWCASLTYPSQFRSLLSPSFQKPFFALTRTCNSNIWISRTCES